MNATGYHESGAEMWLQYHSGTAFEDTTRSTAPFFSSSAYDAARQGT